MKISKRDGSVVPFDKEKLISAIFKAAESVGGSDKLEAEKVAELAYEYLSERFKEDQVPSVEDVQDCVEKALIEKGHAATAKAYILYRHRKAMEREMKKLMGVTDDLKLSLNAVKVLERRYLLKNEEGKPIETPGQLVRRVARYIASAEKRFDGNDNDLKYYEDAFFNIMKNFEFVPNSPTLMNAGTDLGQLSACFVLSVEDNIGAIFDTVKHAAMIHQTGGGTGFCFSFLRPKGDFVKSTAGVASGPISFMTVFDHATNVIKQGGKRRGANMGVLHIWHPDIEEFITAKQTPNFLENFNISVAIDDKFMQAVESDADYELMNPRTNQPIRKIKAESLFNLITYSAWKSAEPGVLFIDTINKTNPTPKYEIHSTNPCVTGDTLIKTKNGLVQIRDLRVSEDVLTLDGNYHKISWVGKTGEKEVWKVTAENGYSVCTTRNHKFFVEPYGWSPLSELSEGDRLITEKEGKFEVSKIKSIEKIGVADVFDATEPTTHSFFANGILVHNCGEVPMPDYESCNLGSINLEKFVDINWSKENWRTKIKWKRLREVVRTAVVFLDNVVELNKYPLERIKQTSQYHRRIGLGVMGFANMLLKMGMRYDSPEAYEIAEEIMRFVTEEGRKMSHELGRARGSFPGFKESVWAKKVDAMRNATVTSIAPTGTISMIADTSSGIEPVFAIAYMKNVMDGTKLYYINEVFEHVLKVRGIYSEELMQKVIENGSIQGIEEIPKDIREVFVISYDISSESHLKIQAAFQKYTDLAVSKTINLPNTASVEDVKHAYLLAWKLGCKGVTVYRDGSRGEQVLNIIKKPSEPQINSEVRVTST